MSDSLASPTFFLDTQALIYAFEKREPLWLSFVESRLLSGWRLVLSEELLYEFAQTESLDAAVELARRAEATSPLWIRSFVDLEADEVGSFARAVTANNPIGPIMAIVQHFSDVSQVGDRYKLDPESFVRFAHNPRTRAGLTGLACGHADIVDQLSRAVASGQMTRELKDQALRSGLRALLARGSSLTERHMGARLADAVKLCFKHHKWLMRECPAYAVEFHLADYRTANPKRVARPSDSMDLMLATAAFPYVTTFVTNDGYLHGALSYVLSRIPTVKTELMRTPERHAANQALQPTVLPSLPLQQNGG